MPKTFSQRVLEWWIKFEAMKPGTAYEISRCTTKPEVFIEMCKDFIDHSEDGNNYTFSDDYLFFQRKPYPPNPINNFEFHSAPILPQNIRVETINEGFVEYQEIKGQKFKIVHSRERGKPYVPSYRIYDGDKLIAIET